MNSLPVTIHERGINYTYTYSHDDFNKRIRFDDYNGSIAEIVKAAIKISLENNCEKLIFKARKEDYEIMLANGFVLEAKVDKYYLGSHMYFFCMYFTSDRRNSDFWAEEDHLLQNVYKSQSKKPSEESHEYELRICDENDATGLADLYHSVFKVYPVPMNDKNYIKKCINDGNLFLAYFHNDKVVSAVSAEVNRLYRNAEITDCATMPEYRQFGLMQQLIARLEEHLFKREIFCLYTIARARSYGMNLAFHRLGYQYRGRLANNCFIFEDIEDMNVWVKIY